MGVPLRKFTLGASLPDEYSQSLYFRWSLLCTFRLPLTLGTRWLSSCTFRALSLAFLFIIDSMKYKKLQPTLTSLNCLRIKFSSVSLFYGMNAIIILLKLSQILYHGSHSWRSFWISPPHGTHDLLWYVGDMLPYQSILGAAEHELLESLFRLKSDRRIMDVGSVIKSFQIFLVVFPRVKSMHAVFLFTNVLKSMNASMTERCARHMVIKLFIAMTPLASPHCAIRHSLLPTCRNEDRPAVVLCYTIYYYFLACRNLEMQDFLLWLELTTFWASSKVRHHPS